jgi:hypothetical protein
LVYMNRAVEGRLRYIPHRNINCTVVGLRRCNYDLTIALMWGIRVKDSNRIVKFRDT